MLVKGDPGGWFNIKMPSYQYRKPHCGDKTILWLSYLHNGISYTGKMTSLYWIRAQIPYIWKNNGSCIWRKMIALHWSLHCLSHIASLNHISAVITTVINITWFQDCFIFVMGIPISGEILFTWWLHDMEMLSALLAPCKQNPPVSDGFPSQRANNMEF